MSTRMMSSIYYYSDGDAVMMVPDKNCIELFDGIVW